LEDLRIIDLYWTRSEDAIFETDKKYGKYCRYIAYHILYSHEDSAECVNDTYVRAWNTMPPARPEKLSAFVGKITRNLALDRLEYNNAQKRCTETMLVLDELAESLPAEETKNVEGTLAESIVIRDVLNRFLESLSLPTRAVFMRRYWYMNTIKEIAQNYGLSESNVKVTLLRTRKKFKELLEKEGIIL